MIVYISKLPIEIESNLFLHRIKEQLEEIGIVGLHAEFEDEEKAKAFCGEDGYFLAGKNTNQ